MEGERENISVRFNGNNVGRPQTAHPGCSGLSGLPSQPEMTRDQCVLDHHHQSHVCHKWPSGAPWFTTRIQPPFRPQPHFQTPQSSQAGFSLISQFGKSRNLGAKGTEISFLCGRE